VKSDELIAHLRTLIGQPITPELINGIAGIAKQRDVLLRAIRLAYVQARDGNWKQARVEILAGLNEVLRFDASGNPIQGV
jgi:hypothetical protein